jgi:peptidoglycan/LPS O-acetylase OafA/YrhL
MLRLGLALLVAVAHALSTGFGHQPHLGSAAVADVAVDGFFVLSGFLVTRSYLMLCSFPRYAWHRFLRIMPGFWVCLLVTAVVAAPLAAVLSGGEPGAVFTAEEDPAWRYPLVNAALPMLQFDIAGLETPTGRHAFDGALWTLQYEAACYAVIGVLGLLGIIQWRARLLLVIVGLVWAGALLEAAGRIPFDVPVFTNESLLRFLLVFLLGAAACVLAHRVPISAGWAVLSLVVVAAAMFLPDYRLLAAVPFTYLCLYAVVRLPLRQNPRWDLSYGVYIYHGPVQFLLAAGGAVVLPEAAFVLVSLALTVPLAALSWWAVEGPALRQKSLQPPPLGRRLLRRRP